MIEPNYRGEQGDGSLETESTQVDSFTDNVVHEDRSKGSDDFTEDTLTIGIMTDLSKAEVDVAAQSGIENSVGNGAENISEEAPVDLGPFDVSLSSINEAIPIRSGAPLGYSHA